MEFIVIDNWFLYFIDLEKATKLFQQLPLCVLLIFCIQNDGKQQQQEQQFSRWTLGNKVTIAQSTKNINKNIRNKKKRWIIIALNQIIEETINVPVFFFY